MVETTQTKVSSCYFEEFDRRFDFRWAKALPQNLTTATCREEADQGERYAIVLRDILLECFRTIPNSDKLFASFDCWPEHALIFVNGEHRFTCYTFWRLLTNGIDVKATPVKEICQSDCCYQRNIFCVKQFYGPNVVSGASILLAPHHLSTRAPVQRWFTPTNPITPSDVSLILDYFEDWSAWEQKESLLQSITTRINLPKRS